MDIIIYPFAPKPDVAQKTRWFQTAMRELNKVGIVGVSDAGMRPDDVSVLESMAEKGELSIRISVMLECTERNTYCPEETRGLKLMTSKKGLGASTLMLGGVKLFADGALGSWGAALLEPYSDKPETSGTMLINETELTTVVNKVCGCHIYRELLLILIVVQYWIPGQHPCHRRPRKSSSCGRL